MQSFQIFTVVLISSLFVLRFSAASGNANRESGQGKRRSELAHRVSILWDTFWSSSCQFSSIASRTRRSPPELPSTQNPDQLFDFMFPLANVKNGQDFTSGRSSSGSGAMPTLSLWLDDALDLWQNGCKNRHKGEEGQEEKEEQGPETQAEKSFPSVKSKKRSLRKRSAVRNQGTLVMNRRGVYHWENHSSYPSYAMPVTTTESSSFDQEAEEYEDEDEEEEAEVEEEDEDDDGGDDNTYSSPTTTTEKTARSPTTTTETPDTATQEEEEEEDETTTTTTAAPPTPLSVIPADSGAEYFASYGGDIEYVFPLASFTVPFDGEIIILGGYHGFNGLSTY